MPPDVPSAARPRARGAALAVAMLAIAALFIAGCSVVAQAGDLDERARRRRVPEYCARTSRTACTFDMSVM